MIIPANKRRQVRINKNIYLSNDFNKFWDKIKYKSMYQVDFDSDEFISECINHLKKLKINYPKIKCVKSTINIDFNGVKASKNSSSEYMFEWNKNLPDIVKFLQNETDLTRKTIVKILIETDTFNLFKINPQEYMIKTSKLINSLKEEFNVERIKYIKLNDSYSQELFKNEEQFGYLEKNLIESRHSVYDYVIYDSEVEKIFGENLENDYDVKLFFKIPTWYKINTPLGNYSPDWAVLLEIKGYKYYCIVEIDKIVNQKHKMKLKLDCVKKHFNAIDNSIYFCVIDSYEKFKLNLQDVHSQIDYEDATEIKNDLIKRINIYFNSNKYEEALFLAETLIKSNDSNEYYNYKAISLINLHRFEEALDCYEKILDRDNENFKTMLNKGNLLMSLNRFKDAIDCYEEILIWQDLNSQQNKMFNHILNQNENSGFFAVSEINHNEYNWVYTYMENDEFKQIFAEDIKKLRRKAYDNNLIWTVLDNNLARQSRKKDLIRGELNE